MTKNKHANRITLEELSAPGCHICKQFEEFWHSIEKNWHNVEYTNIDITTLKGQKLAQEYMIFASPGIIINGKLWSSGGFDRKKLIQKLEQLS